jgi:hypothetical protein
MNMQQWLDDEAAFDEEERIYREFIKDMEDRERERERRMRHYEEVIRQIEEEMKGHNGRLRNLRNR